MSDLYTDEWIVEEKHTDINRHVNNVQYVQWMQDIAIAHSSSLGWTLERYLQFGAGWVVRRHTVEYLSPLHIGRKVRVFTWVATMGRQSSERKYKFIDADSGKVAAAASTLWVYVDMKTGRVRPVDEEVSRDFPLLPADREP